LALFALATSLSASADGSLFAFNHLQDKLGAGYALEGKSDPNLKGVFHSYDGINYGGISINKRSSANLSP